MADQAAIIAELVKRRDQLSPGEQTIVDELARRQTAPSPTSQPDLTTRVKTLLGPTTPQAKPKTFGQKSLDVAYGAAPYVGGLVGGVFGGPPGAALGGSVGAAARGAYRHRPGGDPFNLQTSTQLMGDIAKEGAMQGALEIAGAPVAGALNRLPILRGFSRDVANGTGKAIKDLDTSIPGGIGMTASEIAGRPKSLSRLGEYMGNLGYVSQQVARQGRQAGLERMGGRLEERLSALSPQSRVGGGKVLQNALEGSSGTFKREAGTKYAKVDALTQGANTVDMNPVKLAAQKLKDQMGYAELERANWADLTPAQKSIRGLFDRITTGGERLSFTAAHQLRSDVADLINIPESELITSQAKRVATMLRDNITDTMETSAKRLAPGALPAWQEAKAFWGKGSRIFEANGVVNALKKNPEAVAEVVGPGKVMEAGNLRQALTVYKQYATPEERAVADKAWDAFRQNWIRRNLLKAPEKGVKEMDLMGLAGNMKTAGEDVMRVLFQGDPQGRVMLSNLRLMAEATKRMGNLPSSGMMHGRTALYMGLQLWHRNVGMAVGEATMFEGLPLLMTKIMRSKTLTKRLLEGLVPPRAVPDAARIAQIASVMKDASNETGISVTVEGNKQPGFPTVPPDARIPTGAPAQ